MAWSISTDIEDALWSAAKRCLPPSALGGRALSQAVIARSRLYTSEREQLGKMLPDRADPADLAARALFFTVADAAKIHIPLAELQGSDLLPGLRPGQGTLEILDIGAGAGAMTLGALDYLRRIGALTRGLQIAVHAIDRDGRALQLLCAAVAELCRRWDVNIAVTTECADIVGAAADLSGKVPHLVFAGSVFNELPEPARQPLMASLLAAMAPDGAVIAMEPALRVTARELHELRDWICENRLAHVFAPCTRRGAPCPALAAESDWCHEDRPGNLTPRAARLAAATGLRTHGLKFAYLVLRKERAFQVAVQGDDSAALRIVSQPKKSKGKRECYVCSDAGRHLVRLLRRHRSAANRSFADGERGDVVIAPERVAHGGDIESSDPVIVQGPHRGSF